MAGIILSLVGFLLLALRLSSAQTIVVQPGPGLDLATQSELEATLLRQPTAPATCTPGQLALWFDTDAPPGLNLYGCTAPNTWTLLGDGPGGYGVAVQVASSGTINTGTEYVTTGAGGVTRSLPAAVSGTSTRRFVVFKTDAGVGALTIAPFSGNTINGLPASLTTTTQWAGFVIQEHSTTNWTAYLVAPTGGGAPPEVPYWTARADAGLSAEVSLGALSTGLLKHSVSGGVSTPATASPGTDYLTPTGSEDVSGKRIAPRKLQLSVPTGTPAAPNCAVAGGDIYYRYDVTGALTLPAATGTCQDGQKLVFEFKPTTTPQALSFTTGASKAYSAEQGVALPTTTGDSATYVQHVFQYNSFSDRFAYLGGTDQTGPVALGDGGTGAALSDPGGHRVLGWDDTDNATRWITLGTGLTYDAPTDTLSASVGGVTDGDKGDITVSGSGATWTLDNNTVTLAKLADIATASILGRTTAATGDPEVLTAAQARTVLNVDAYTGTFTNKTFDAEGTGNTLTTSSKIWLEAASCQGTSAALQWDTPATNAPVAVCVTGTNVVKGVAEFADGANLSMQRTFALPADFTGAIDARLKWMSTTGSTANVVWQLATSCVADGETDDPAFNTASTVTDAGKATANQTNDAALTGITMTGCAAGELLHLQVRRDSAHASDTFAGTARLFGVELTMRRQQ